MFKINWNQDKQIIQSALSDTKVFTKHHLETHIIIGTSLYIDHFSESFRELIPFWNSRIQKIYGLRNNESIYDDLKDKTIYLSYPHNHVTFLNGWKTTFSTKDQVRQAYYDSKRKVKDKTISVNDDLEELNSRICNPHKQLSLFKQKPVKTFLYEMLSDDEMENQQSNELQFQRSDCGRLTVTLY